MLAERFSANWGKSVVVENATGSGGNIAVERAVKSAPDGYTLLMASNAIAINPSLYPALPYNAMKRPRADIARGDDAGHPGRQQRRAGQDRAGACGARAGAARQGRRRPRRRRNAGASRRRAVQVAAGVDVQQVPYRGIPALLPDLLAGRISAAFPNISVVLQLVREGKLRALAVTSRRRAAATPDVPTMAEAGFSGIDADAWFGLMAPAGTPTPIVERLHRESVRILAQGDVRRRLDELGMRWWRIRRRNSPR